MEKSPPLREWFRTFSNVATWTVKQGFLDTQSRKWSTTFSKLAR